MKWGSVCWGAWMCVCALRADEGKWGVGVAVGYGDILSPAETRRQTDAAPMVSGGARYGVTPRGDVWVNLDDVNAAGQGSVGKSRLRSVTVNWLQSFGEGTWRPQLSVGVGPVWTRRTGSTAASRGQLVGRLGAGVERSWGDTWALGLQCGWLKAFSDGRQAPAATGAGIQLGLTRFFECRRPSMPGRKGPPSAPPPAAVPLTPWERDSDKDGVADGRDTCPNTPAGTVVDALGCPIDSDGDGVADLSDKCPGTPAGMPVNLDGCAKDADGDGVPDPLDKCPGTPSGTSVDALGCPKDTDGDGVLDAADKCPDTPVGVLVNAEGCPTKKVSVTLEVKFESGKAVLSQEFDDQIKKVAEFMRKYPETKVVIEGHTDNVGGLDPNKALSLRRAEAVKSALVKKFGVAEERITAKGFGAGVPLADNSTPLGRARNRRVVAVISTVR